MGFGWFRSDTEKKRDDYLKLYEKLQKAVTEHDKKVNDAASAFYSYKNASPYLSSNKIPSNHFSPKLSELEENLQRYYKYEMNKRSELIAAKSKAYERYAHYKNLAIKEAEKD